MLKIAIFFIVSQAVFATHCLAHKKAVVLQNVWSNDLNNFNPKEFFGKVYQLLREQLSLNQIVEDPKSLEITNKAVDWDKRTRERLQQRSPGSDTAYFITLANELRLPKINIGKLFFKNPLRSSKFTFTYHVYDGSGNEIWGDTIINRGCLTTTVNEEKGNTYFYPDYESFMNDMNCHLLVIRKEIAEKISAINKIH